MDYIIFGTGSSATLVLIGWLIRDWGPRIRDRRPAEDEILSASDLVIRMAWARFCASGGMALLICGVLITLATLGAALLAPTDRGATIAVTATFGLTAILMLIWTGLYLRQFGTMGVLRPRPKPERRETPTVAVDETRAAEPLEPADAEDAPASAPAPSFAETTAARGGLGRFASFFRRDPVETPASDVDEWDDEHEPETDPDWAPEAIEVDAEGHAPPPSPTEAVIAELAGDGGDEGPDEKTLQPDDPLVTSVRPVAEPISIEDSIVTDIVGDQPRNDHSVEDDGDAIDDANATTGEMPEDGTSSSESAIDQLRRRRISRLANQGEPD